MSKTNEADLEWTTIAHGETKMRRKQLGEATDATEVGASLFELPPGQKSWPYHYHTANEEAMYVLDGTGQVRTPDETYDVMEGDYLSFPADESGAHRVINDADEPLRYLVVSTMNDPDVAVYPDSNKIGVFVDSAPGSRAERSLHGYYSIDDDVDYWQDE